jgi:hypothetical protein
MAMDTALWIVRYGLARLPEAESLPVFEICISRAKMHLEPKITVITITINRNGLRIIVFLPGQILIRNMVVVLVSLFIAHNMCTVLGGTSPTLLAAAQSCRQEGS